MANSGSQRDFKLGSGAQQPAATGTATRVVGAASAAASTVGASAGSAAIAAVTGPRAIDLTKSRNQQSSNSFLPKVDPNVMKQKLSPFLTIRNKASLSTSCVGLYNTLYTMYQPSLNQLKKKVLQQLLQAVVDDDRVTAEKTVRLYPGLLLAEPKDVEITFIESKYTFQRFLTEKALVMAQKLHRLEITKILLSAFEKLENNQAGKGTDAKDEKTALQTQWVLPPYDEKQQSLADEKLRQQYIRDYFTPLANTIVKDPCVNSVANAETENVLEGFRNILLSEHPVAIDNYVDAEQFLIAAYQACDAHFNRLSWNQRDVFAIRVIGLAQSLSSPELGKVFCHPQGLYNYANNRARPFDQRALDMKLSDGTPFYRSSRSSRAHLGFDFLCSVYGARVGWGWARVGWRDGVIALAPVLKSYVEQERRSLASLRDEYQVRRDIMFRQ